jgi:hypothetical protein
MNQILKELRIYSVGIPEDGASKILDERASKGVGKLATGTVGPTGAMAFTIPLRGATSQLLLIFMDCLGVTYWISS